MLGYDILSSLLGMKVLLYQKDTDMCNHDCWCLWVNILHIQHKVGVHRHSLRLNIHYLHILDHTHIQPPVKTLEQQN
ncbi:hypothetical protein E2C01_043745 [Portunus trituberculatus]|uniref:Uncharacterized protein n=1 Tax=Portunus trituberculatus TaxID=210409 RepID=A0A5B7FQ97_PORTR|nr:hypothetical protein [Portunus trituberculatus]